MNKKDLPVEINDKELPVDPLNNHKEFTSEVENPNVSGGFANFLFLGVVMGICFLLGMLTIILKGV